MQKEKILYIHGLGSDSKSSTGNYIKDLLAEQYEVLIPSWDLTSTPSDTVKSINKFIADNEITIIIASSLGAFFALNTQREIKKILLNPCLEPSVQIPKLTFLEESQLIDFQSLEKIWIDNAKNNQNIFGGFGDNDELFNYQDLFRKRYGENLIIVVGGHKLPNVSLEKVIKKGLSYFNIPTALNI